ncbi:unnamed protein product [Dibothriocephalus latus]|uniref:Uncharacterized protein n=1 Tax=Dibothriocephalus latus TaxID=60516 RepID=A0A3P6UT90_DIBLA|nr:unnamed protein product [Dibothriocephalus latus]
MTSLSILLILAVAQALLCQASPVYQGLEVEHDMDDPNLSGVNAKQEEKEDEKNASEREDELTAEYDEGVIHIPSPEFPSVVLENSQFQTGQDRLCNESGNERTHWRALHLFVDSSVEVEVRLESEL